MSEEGLAVGMRSHASPAVKQRDGKTDSRRTPIAKSQAPDARNTTANRGVMSFAFDCFGCGDSIVLSPGSNAWTCPSSLPTHTCRETHATPIPEVKQDRSVFGAGPRIDGWDIQSKLIEVQFMRRMVETYLAKVNPFLPCLNVTRMRSDVEAMLAGKLPRKESRQVGAAADLMTAVMMAMTEDAACITRPGWIPGWTEYDRAERLLRDGSHSDRETLGTVQCFILKALYLICIDKFNLAYDTMGTVARLCYQLELHDEKRWRNQSSFEIHLRQRILWTAFFLDSHISQYCNAPYLLRFSDVDVPIPRHIDDKKLQPDSDLLPEEDSNAPIVNLDTCSQYARLYSEIWDRVLTVNASRRCSPETAAAIERQIKDLRRGLPVHLQWNQYDSSRLSAERSSHFHVRQSMLLHLVSFCRIGCLLGIADTNVE
ncbi:hypothetical protein N7470_002188 [Penicillium chermesinum]|nr:hypothetical protein N7470_002188 [Penicillium chermesinum]